MSDIDIYEDEHEKPSTPLPPPGFAQPIEPGPSKAITDPERHVQEAAGGWVYIEEFVALPGPDAQEEAFWRSTACRKNTNISVEVDHPNREVAKSACYRAVEILEREVPV